MYANISYLIDIDPKTIDTPKFKILENTLVYANSYLSCTINGYRMSTRCKLKACKLPIHSVRTADLSNLLCNKICRGNMVLVYRVANKM